MSMGKRLRELRIKKNKTLKEQSEILGVSLNTIYRWEHNLTKPREAKLKKLADYYDVTVGWLLYGNLDAEYIMKDNDFSVTGDRIETQILCMIQKLSENYKYKILGYVECIYTESTHNE